MVAGNPGTAPDRAYVNIDCALDDGFELGVGPNCFGYPALTLFNGRRVAGLVINEHELRGNAYDVIACLEERYPGVRERLLANDQSMVRLMTAKETPVSDCAEAVIGDVMRRSGARFYVRPLPGSEPGTYEAFFYRNGDSERLKTRNHRYPPLEGADALQATSFTALMALLTDVDPATYIHQLVRRPKFVPSDWALRHGLDIEW